MNPIQLSGENFAVPCAIPCFVPCAVPYAEPCAIKWLQHYEEHVFRHIEPQQRPFKATDNYPGPPNVGGKMMGSVRCPSYSRAVRGLHNADRSPPPDYKSNRNGKRNEVIETIDDFIEA